MKIKNKRRNKEDTAHFFFSPRMRCNFSLSVKPLNSGQYFSNCGSNSSLMFLYCVCDIVLESVVLFLQFPRHSDSTACPLWAARSDSVCPSVLPDCGHSICTLSMSFSGSSQFLWLGIVPQYTRAVNEYSKFEYVFEY